MIASISKVKATLAAVAFRILSVIAVWLIIWKATYHPGALFYVVMGTLLFSNFILIALSRKMPDSAVARYFIIADGILLPIAAAGVGSPVPEVQIVFILAILVASCSAWVGAPLVSFAVGMAVNTSFAFGGQSNFYIGSPGYMLWLMVLFCVAALGVYFSTALRKERLSKEVARDEMQKRQLMIEDATKTVSHWMNIYKTAVSGIPSGIVLFDRDLHLILTNDAFSRLVGQEPSEMINQTPSQYFPEKVIGKLGLRNKLSRVVDSGVLLEPEEMDIPVEGHKPRTMVFRAFPIYDHTGKIAFVLAVFDDITELKVAKKEVKKERASARLAKKKAEEEKQLATEYKRLDALKSEFVSMASHELRTPMASIKGALGLLTDGTSGPVTDAQRKWIDMALKNVDRLTVLLNDTLDVAKIEAGKFVLHPMEMDISSVVEQIGAEYAVKAKETGHAIEWKSEKPSVTAFTDSDAFRRVLINLVGNAIFHTASGTKIVIRAYSMKKGNMSCVEVADNGKGIAPENLEKIFEPYFQADRQVGEGPKGTGLGLPICKGLVEQMGGKLWVESELGKGTTFFATLPLDKETRDANLSSNENKP